MTLKKEIEEILHPEKRLHPPRAPSKKSACEDCRFLVQNINKYGAFYCKELNITMMDLVPKCVHKETIVGEKQRKVGDGVRGAPEKNNGSPSTDSKPTIDFLAIANASEFRRFIYWIRTGKVHRGSNDQLKEDLRETQKDIETIKELRKIDPNARNFGNVINEFKDKVERLRKRNE